MSYVLGPIVQLTNGGELRTVAYNGEQFMIRRHTGKDVYHLLHSPEHNADGKSWEEAAEKLLLINK